MLLLFIYFYLYFQCAFKNHLKVPRMTQKRSFLLIAFRGKSTTL